MSGLSQPRRALLAARRRFYLAGGPWLRCRLFERAGSLRYSRPALFDLDDVIERHLPERGGVFVEAGAHDGYTQSNTYYLERHRGWSGVLVEAIPALAQTAAQRRPRSRVVNCALVASERDGPTITMRFDDLMSTVAGGAAERPQAAAGRTHDGQHAYAIEVPARTLSAVLEDAGADTVDLLCLDLEGLELDVLRGTDLDRHAPRYLLVEMLDHDAQRPAFDDLLGVRYEAVERASPYDVLYRRRSA
jgi:FkbM family methyltransferase